MYKPFSFFDPAFVGNLLKVKAFIQATGGEINEYDENGITYRSHTFLSNGTFEVTKLGITPEFNELEVLLVAGGGSSANRLAGGGGAGGYLLDDLNASLGQFNMVIGAGGTAPTNTTDVRLLSVNGENTTAFSLTAIGGGGGGVLDNPVGSNGGSGGGARGGGGTAAGVLGGTGTSGQGNNGGANGTDGGFSSGGGGGGGAGNSGFAGGSSSGFKAGAGGDGLSNTLRDGTVQFYAGGGGGGGADSTAVPIATGGLGGGGDGGVTSAQPGQNGAANTGGGGGGGGFTGNVNAQSGNGGSGIVIVRYPIAIPDLDALAFLTAAEITDPTITTAIYNLVIGLKAEAIWDKLIAIYPFVGGTATTHKWNLKDPRDLDAAFRLQFFGGMTHNANGVTGNGTDAYYETFINPSNNFGLNNASGWVYSRINSNVGVDFGVLISSLGFQLNTRNASNNMTSRLNATDLGTVSNSNSLGLFGISRDNSNNYYHYINGTFSTLNIASTDRADGNLMGLSISGSSLFSDRNHAIAAFGESLTQAQATEFDNLVQAFQTELGREITP